jgi:sodium transport system ATP-binding protein
MSVLISAENLRKQFETSAGNVLAVDDVSLSIAAGETYGLLGANGAGKTTTLRMILGLLQPTSGSATVAGYSVSERPDEVKRNVALVSASAGLYQWLTPREMMLYFADLYDVPDGKAAARAQQLIELFELTTFSDRPCSGLSTGQTQRVNLARSLMHDPPVVMMDEPTRGLDIVGSKRIFDFTDHLRSQGKAVVICTHRLDEAERLCSRFGLMHRGRLELEGTIEELSEQTGMTHLTDMFLDLMARPQAVAAS